MPSPFPGMNPYLEQEDVWQDFHQSFLPIVRDILSPQVSPAYIVKIEEHLFVHEIDSPGRQMLGRADVALARTNRADAGAPATAILQAPMRLQLPRTDVEKHAYLEIRDRRQRQLVTV